jgi:hypothetical protein
MLEKSVRKPGQSGYSMCEIEDTISDRVLYQAMWFRQARIASIDPTEA